MKRPVLALVAVFALLGTPVVTGCGALRACNQLQSLFHEDPNYKKLPEALGRVSEGKSSEDDRKLIAGMATQLKKIAATGDGRPSDKAEKAATALEGALDGSYDQAEAKQVKDALEDLRNTSTEACSNISGQ